MLCDVLLAIRYYASKQNVSILVLMEYALRLQGTTSEGKPCYSLNPCFNGICSATYNIMAAISFRNFVSILVLMEYALRLIHRF